MLRGDAAGTLGERLAAVIAAARRAREEQPGRRAVWDAAEAAAVRLLRAADPVAAARPRLADLLAGHGPLREAVGLYLQFGPPAAAHLAAAAAPGPPPDGPRQLDLFALPPPVADPAAASDLARVVGWRLPEPAVVAVLRLLGGPEWPPAARRAGLPPHLVALDPALRAEVGVLSLALGP
jgi:hypothetical protein